MALSNYFFSTKATIFFWLWRSMRALVIYWHVRNCVMEAHSAQFPSTFARIKKTLKTNAIEISNTNSRAISRNKLIKPTRSKKAWKGYRYVARERLQLLIFFAGRKKKESGFFFHLTCVRRSARALRRWQEKNHSSIRKGAKRCDKFWRCSRFLPSL